MRSDWPMGLSVRDHLDYISLWVAPLPRCGLLVWVTVKNVRTGMHACMHAFLLSEPGCGCDVTTSLDLSPL